MLTAVSIFKHEISRKKMIIFSENNGINSVEEKERKKWEMRCCECLSVSDEVSDFSRLWFIAMAIVLEHIAKCPFVMFLCFRCDKIGAKPLWMMARRHCTAAVSIIIVVSMASSSEWLKAFHKTTQHILLRIVTDAREMENGNKH